MMTKERAKFLLSKQKYGDIPMTFLRSCDMPGKKLDPEGITEEEDREIKSLWETMPSWTCYMHALMRIANGE